MTASTAKSRSERLVGTVIADRFLVKRRLAAGGMGVVYHAEQIPLGRPVALKIMEPRGDEESTVRFSERFLLEAAAVAKLQHPNTIVLYDYGETDDDAFFYAMEFVDGVNLRTWVRKRGALHARDAIHVGMQVAGSVREAHRGGMIHRDLKPGNIMVTERHDDPWFVKVLDFGLVKVLGASDGADLTQSGMLLGSPRYMAPEQVLGGELDHRVDIYALGAVLYYTLTGRAMFTDDSKFEVMRAQVDDAPQPFAEVNPDHDATPRLEAAVMRCVAKDPDERFQSLDELGEELAACARDMGVEEPSLSGARAFDSGLQRARASVAPREPKPSPSPAAVAAPVDAEAEPKSRMPLMLALAALAGLALSLGVVFAIVYVAPGPAPSPEPAPEAQPAPETSAHAVRIESDPPGARVRRGDEDLGDAPFSLEIPDGERWELTLSLAAHESRTLTVTSGRDRLMVHLTPVEAPEDPPSDTEEPAPTPPRQTGRRSAQPRDETPPTPHQLAPTPPPAPTPTPTPSTSTTTQRRGSSSPTDLRDPWKGK